MDKFEINEQQREWLVAFLEETKKEILSKTTEKIVNQLLQKLEEVK